MRDQQKGQRTWYRQEAEAHMSCPAGQKSPGPRKNMTMKAENTTHKYGDEENYAETFNTWPLKRD